MSKDGGHAFPTTDSIMAGEGMSMRDYFAAQALTGILLWDALINQRGKSYYEGEGGDTKMASVAYAIADAMLAERSIT